MVFTDLNIIGLVLHYLSYLIVHVHVFTNYTYRVTTLPGELRKSVKLKTDPESPGILKVFVK